MGWGDAPSGICTETEERPAWKHTGQADAADWKLLDQFVGFWWWTVSSSGTHTWPDKARQVGSHSYRVVLGLLGLTFLKTPSPWTQLIQPSFKDVSCASAVVNDRDGTPQPLNRFCAYTLLHVNPTVKLKGCVGPRSVHFGWGSINGRFLLETSLCVALQWISISTHRTTFFLWFTAASKNGCARQ